MLSSVTVKSCLEDAEIEGDSLGIADLSKFTLPASISSSSSTKSSICRRSRRGSRARSGRSRSPRIARRHRRKCQTCCGEKRQRVRLRDLALCTASAGCTRSGFPLAGGRQEICNRHVQAIGTGQPDDPQLELPRRIEERLHVLRSPLGSPTSESSKPFKFVKRVGSTAGGLTATPTNTSRPSRALRPWSFTSAGPRSRRTSRTPTHDPL